MINCENKSSPSSPIIDCSYSGAEYEIPLISYAEEGEFYVILVTNYSDIVQIATLNQASGTGEVDCESVPGRSYFKY